MTPHTSKAAAPLSVEAAYTYTDGVLTLPSEQQAKETLSDSVTVDNGLLELNFSRSTGKLHSIQNRQAGVTENVTLDMAAYLSGAKAAALCPVKMQCKRAKCLVSAMRDSFSPKNGKINNGLLDWSFS